MTNRERILAIMEGRVPDRIPWIPRLQIWYEANRRTHTLPERYCRLSLRDVERNVFAGTAARDAIIYRTEIRDAEVRRRRLTDMETLIEYVTPVGTVTSRLRGSAQLRRQGIQDLEVEFVLKRREDYPVVEYLIEHTCFTPAFDEYERYERAGFGMVECFATHPMVETTLAEARAVWGDRVIIWGGVPSVILEEPYSDEQFEQYMDDLFRTIAPGNAFILGVADNVMPGSKIERIERITRMVQRRGAYPISHIGSIGSP